LPFSAFFAFSACGSLLAFGAVAERGAGEAAALKVVNGQAHAENAEYAEKG